MNTLKLVILSIFAIVGLALIAPAAAQWQALQIQAGLGDNAPLQSAIIKMLGGMVCMAIAWFGLKSTNFEGE
jgi:uncharacterized membrane protein YidH (DUF202 family)